MIGRIWHDYTRPGNADAFEAQLWSSWLALLTET
jgi:hypothetical protein